MSKIKVAGYSKKIQYTDGIEYRPFSSGLFGNQFENNGDTSLFTSGNFNVTTNLEPKTDKIFSTNNYGNLISLDDLKLKDFNNVNLNKFNFDKKDIKNYAYFGSLREFIRVSLENIIVGWPASLFISPTNNLNPNFHGLTVENYVFDELTNTSIFSINNNVINNPFNIDYSIFNGGLFNNLNLLNDTRNLNKNFTDYVLSVNSIDYEILEFNGLLNNYIKIKVSGKPFDTDNYISYHIRPNNKIIKIFFDSLPIFDSYLLNLESTPKYKSEFDYFVETDFGDLIKSSIELIWPVNDGYNIDFNSDYYINYVNKLIDIADKSDESKTNILSRFLVSQSILEFDTIDLKINKTLNVYGRQFDTIKNYIDSISNVYTVTYDGVNNVIDRDLKKLANLLGWVNLPYIENSDNNLEFYKKLIINTPWIWKAKGNRKSIEFILKLFGFPDGLLEFNEFIYVVKNKIDINLFNEVLSNLNMTLDETFFIDKNGFPNVAENNSEMYYQKGGLWIRETAGVNSKLDILIGNNPHVGPYDYGNEYLLNFYNLIPNFSSTKIIDETTEKKITNLFLNNNLGDFCDTNINPSITLSNSVITNNCTIVSSEIVNYQKQVEYDNCGCVINNCDGVLKINYEPNVRQINCDYISEELNENGLVLFTLNDGTRTFNFNSECCTNIGYTPDIDENGLSVCKWKIDSVNPCKDYVYWQIIDGYQIFINNNGEFFKEIDLPQCCPINSTPMLQPNGKYTCKF